MDASGRVTARSLGRCVVTAQSPDYTPLITECELSVVREQPGFRYFLLAIDGVQGGNSVQMAELDLLDAAGTEHAPLSMYASDAEGYTHEGPENVVDGNLDTKWCGPLKQTACLYLDAGMALRPSAYRFYTAGDAQTYAMRNPSSWRFYGSNTPLTTPDDAGWVLLDQHTDDVSIGAVNQAPFDFPIDYSQVPDGINGIAEDAPDGAGKRFQGVYDLLGRRWQSSQEAQKANRIILRGGRKVVN